MTATEWLCLLQIAPLKVGGAASACKHLKRMLCLWVTSLCNGTLHNEAGIRQFAMPLAKPVLLVLLVARLKQTVMATVSASKMTLLDPEADGTLVPSYLGSCMLHIRDLIEHQDLTHHTSKGCTL